MTIDLQHATARLSTLRDALLAGYTDEDLHQLRVTLRRMRSALRGRSGGRARKLRRRLGALARTTNAARDWDTLYANAREQLGPEQFTPLQSLLHERRESARAQVYRVFHAKQWAATLRQWDAMVATSDPGAESLHVTPGKLATRLKRAQVAADKALARNDERRWHKLRIAIKELRYALDTGEEDTLADSQAQLLQECKTLQTLLGDWHDTLVHRQLLDTLADSGSLDPKTPAGKAASEFRRILAEKGLESLEQVKYQLQRDVLAPAEAG
jgi:CHAD domain-containing protein